MRTQSKGSESAGRKRESFGSGHLLFTCILDSYAAALDKAASRRRPSSRPSTKASTIQAAAAEGRSEDILSATGRLWQQGCAACHERFRDDD